MLVATTRYSLFNNCNALWFLQIQNVELMDLNLYSCIFKYVLDELPHWLDWNYPLHGLWLTRPLIKLTSHYSKLNVSIIKLNDDKFIFMISHSTGTNQKNNQSFNMSQMIKCIIISMTDNSWRCKWRNQVLYDLFVTKITPDLTWLILVVKMNEKLLSHK